MGCDSGRLYPSFTAEQSVIGVSTKPISFPGFIRISRLISCFILFSQSSHFSFMSLIKCYLQSDKPFCNYLFKCRKRYSNLQPALSLSYADIYDFLISYFLFLIYLLYHNFLKKSIRKNWFFHQVEFNHNSCYIYLIGEFHETRCLSQIVILQTSLLNFFS